MAKILTAIRKIIGEERSLDYKYRYFNAFSRAFLLPNSSFSQCGEDMVINHILNGRRDGFFVDIGAFHPIKLSNTFYFYNRGWRGINIDATPGSSKVFNRLRPKDINIEFGIADKDSTSDYYMFSYPELNTFDAENAKRLEVSGARLISVVQVKTTSLTSILDQHMPEGRNKIDFLNIDVEGLDEVVIRSNDWTKFKPEIIAIERHLSLEDFLSDTLFEYLTELKYGLVAKAGPTYIFQCFA